MSRVVRTGVDNTAEMRQFADVTYEYSADGRKRTSTRVRIGEDLGNGDDAGTQLRYRPGTEVTVYYNPKNPDQAVLERDPPARLFHVIVLFIAALTSGAIVAVDGTVGIANILRGELPNPKNAPYVIGFSFFAFCCAVMALAIGKNKSAEVVERRVQTQGLWILWACATPFSIAAYWFATTLGGKF